MSSRYLAGDLVINTGSRSVSKNGERLALSELSFATLLELVINAPESVSVEQLAANVWKSDHVTAETIAQRIRILRRSLDDEPQSPTYVRTVRHQGYAFVAPVELENPRVGFSKKKVMFGVAATLVTAIVLSWIFLKPSVPHIEPEFTQQTPSEIEQMVARAADLLSAQRAATTDQGIAILDNALELDPDNPRIIVSLSFALSTRATKFSPHENDSERAEALAKQAIGMNSNDSNAWHALGYALDSRGRVDPALDAYQMAYELNPNDYAAMSSAAYLYQIRGRIFDSLVLEANAMSIAQDRYSRYADSQIAVSLELLGHQAANDWRERAQRIGPDQVVVLAETATSFLRSGDPAAAEQLLEDFAANENTAPRLTRLLGRAVLARGDRRGAQRLFEKAGNRASTDLAALLALDGDYDMAQSRLRELEKSMIEGDSWPETRIQAAELNAVLGNSDEAIEFISQAIDLGWRDIGLLRRSPFLQSSQQSEGWAFIENRIESQLLIQKRLVTQSDTLQSVLSI